MINRSIRCAFCRAFVLVLVGTAVTACVETTVEHFRKVPESRVDSAYVKAGVDFSRYRKLQPAPLEIYYAEGPAEPDPEDLVRIRQIFRDAFLAAIGTDYEIVDKPGGDVLGVLASVVDLELTPAQGSLPMSGRAASLVADGQLSFFMELTDSETGEVLARAGDQKPAGKESGEAAAGRDWTHTEVAAERWARLFRDFLDENLGR